VRAPRHELTTERLFLSVREFCAACGISRATLYRLAAASRAPKFSKVGGRTLIRRSTAEEWAERQEQESATVDLKPRGRAAHPSLADVFSGRRR
jgi:excisionase family DNA binding protein